MDNTEALKLLSYHAAEIQRITASLEGGNAVQTIPPSQLSGKEQVELLCQEWGVVIGHGRIASGLICEEVTAKLLDMKPNTLARQATEGRCILDFKRVNGKRYYHPEDIGAEIDRGNRGNSRNPAMGNNNGSL